MALPFILSVGSRTEEGVLQVERADGRVQKPRIDIGIGTRSLVLL
jgi:hypothetical protein